MLAHSNSQATAGLESQVCLEGVRGVGVGGARQLPALPAFSPLWAKQQGSIPLPPHTTQSLKNSHKSPDLTRHPHPPSL